MKIFAEDLMSNYAISRIVKALKDNAPDWAEFVDDESEADLVIIYAYGHRRHVWWRTLRLKEQGKKSAIVQLVVRSTRNPKTEDWLPIWNDAELVWSYYDLYDYCAEDGNKPSFKFYLAPLGVDPSIFKETKSKKVYRIVAGNSRDENTNQCINAANGDAYVLGQNISDDELAKVYSQSEYVSGLRRTEGFEMPVLEGLMCGARPVCFNRPHYKKWFGDLAEYIEEDDNVEESLRKLFAKPVRRVNDVEKARVKRLFNWYTITKGFWERI